MQMPFLYRQRNVFGFECHGVEREPHEMNAEQYQELKQLQLYAFTTMPLMADALKPKLTANMFLEAAQQQ
jgi:hypothetical protein